MKILIVNGYPRSGKDLFCANAIKNCHLIYPISTIDKVKEIASAIGWDGIKDARGRKFLSDLKDAMTSYDDLPRKYVVQWIEKQLSILDSTMFDSSEAIFLVQMREPDEIERWINLYNAKSLFIYRGEMDKQWGNHADDKVADYNYDYYLNNSKDKEYWEQRTVEFIEQLRNENWESHL